MSLYFTDCVLLFFQLFIFALITTMLLFTLLQQAMPLLMGTITSCPFKERDRSSSEDMFTLDGEISLSNVFQFWASIGKSKVSKYIHKYYFERTGTVKWPNKEVVMRQIQVMMEDVEAAAKLNQCLLLEPE